MTAWDPPSRVAFTWAHREPPGETEVEVRFTPDEEGTLVELEHHGWERLTDGATQQAEYDADWDYVLSRYADAAAPA